MKGYLDDDAHATHTTFMKGDTIQIPFAWKEHPLSAEEPQAERTFTFWVTGISTADDEKCKEEAKFSKDNWGPSTMSYITLVGNLNTRKWAKIKNAAREHMAPSKSSITLLHQAPVDARGSLFEEDSETEL
ncbi:hypothetical protein BYT27DRAFT_7226078 [Phlegmacium glaucopus]|nr:hypothetical protein BYT27DRAFT_7226078 [Phlegmacium glaucopus]